MLVLSGHKLAVPDDIGVVWRHARVERADFFQYRLREVRNEEAAAEHTLKFPIALERIASGASAANAVRNIAEGDGAVADGADHLFPAPEIFENLRDVFVRIEIESRPAPARDMHGIVLAQVDVLEFQG